MRSIARFSLEKHEGPYEKWPLRSKLFLDEKPTGIRVPGYSLIHQFEIPCGYLLVTDDDCPFEEGTNFILLSKSIRLLSWRILVVPYGSFNLDRVEWIDDSRFWAVFYEEDYWLVTIRPWGIPFLRPRLLVQQRARTNVEINADRG
jgi:hypothetical protein